MLGLDQTAIGAEVLDAGEALDAVNLVENREGQDRTDPGNGAEQQQRRRLVVARLVLDLLLEIADQGVIDVAELQVGFDGGADYRIRKAGGQFRPVFGGLQFARGLDQVDWWNVFWMWAKSSARLRAKKRRRRIRSRVARITGG